MQLNGVTRPSPISRFDSRGGIAAVIERLRGERARWDVVVIGALLTVAIFVVDLFIPVGIASGVLYIAPVFLAIWLPDRRLIIAVAAVCSALILIGLWMSPLGSELTVAGPNRLLSIAVVWTTALLAFQRKGFESALSESEATHRAVLATTADGILTVDAEGRILTANQSVEDMFGLIAEDLIGRPFTHVLDDEDAALFRQNQDEFLTAKAVSAPPTHEMTAVHESGSAFPIEVVFVPVVHEDGLLFTVTLRDISERRLFEQHVLRRTDEERQAIGYTLHEEVGQALTGLSLLSRRLARRLEGLDREEAQDASDLAQLLHDVDEQALKLFAAVAPVAASGGLPDALITMARATAGRNGITCSVTTDGTPAPLDEFAAAQLYDIARELVETVLLDGQTQHIDVSIGPNGDSDCLRFRFSGVRSDGDTDREALLRRLQYRAKLIGGRLEAATDSDVLSVTCAWPRADSVLQARQNGQ